MNIAGMIGHLIQHMQTSSARVELTPGQILKGKVLKLFPQTGLAQVQLGGMTLHAMLEAPLKAGEEAWLQVQPGQHPVTLRVLKRDQGAPASKSTSADFSAILRSFGLTDNKPGREAIRFFIEHQLPVNKARVQQLAQYVKLHGLNTEDTPFLLLAANKDFPLTEQTIQSLKTFFTGAPVQAKLEQWLQAAASYLGSRGVSVPSQQTVAADTVQVQTSAATSAQNRTPMEPGNRSSNPVDQRLLSVPENRQRGQHKLPDLSNAPLERDGDEHRLPAVKEGMQHQPQQQQQMTLSKLPVTEVVRQLFQLLFSIKTSQEAGTSRQIHQQHSTGAAPAGTEEGATVPNPVNVRELPSSFRSETIDPARFVKQLGLEYERELMQHLSRHSLLQTERGENAQPTGKSQLDLELSNQIKPLLVHLTQHGEELPSALRESSQSLLQHVTGQQLMLTSSVSQPSFTEMVFQLPFFMDDSSRKAVVHLQSRKKENGQIDRDNCRLLFHLQMARLGETMADVHIVNRAITIVLFTDHEDVQTGLIFQWMKEGETALRKQLEGHGYQLLSLRHQQSKRDRVSPGTAAATQGSSAITYSPYKGVDIRI